MIQTGKYLMNLFLKSIFYCVWFFSFSATAGPCEDSMKSDTTNTNKPTNEVVVSGTPPAVEFQLPVVGSVDSTANQFSRAFNKGEFRGDERFISFFRDNPEYVSFGEVVSVTDNTVEARRISYRKGYLIGAFRLSAKELDNAEVSSESRDSFRRYEEYLGTIKSFRASRGKEEIELKEKGFKDDYVRDIDEANALVELGKKLRESKADPYKTHIEDLVDRVSEHIKVIREGILFQGVEVKERLDMLDEFAREANEKIEKKQLTYIYWFVWNKRLSILATPSSGRVQDFELDPDGDLHVNELGNWWKPQSYKALKRGELEKNFLNINRIAGYFPFIIFLPSVAGNVGTMALNRFTGTGISVVGLVGVETLRMTPTYFFNHDMQHHMDLQFQNRLFNLDKLLQTSEKPMTVEDRQIMESMFYRITHEEPDFGELLVALRAQTVMRAGARVMGMIGRDFLYNSKTEIEGRIRKEVLEEVIGEESQNIIQFNKDNRDEEEFAKVNEFLDRAIDSLKNEENWLQEIEAQKNIERIIDREGEKKGELWKKDKDLRDYFEEHWGREYVKDYDSYHSPPPPRGFF